jgi:hypothetical protein
MTCGSVALGIGTAPIGWTRRNQVQVANLGVQPKEEWIRRGTAKAGVANNIEVIQAQDSLSQRQPDCRALPFTRRARPCAVNRADGKVYGMRGTMTLRSR